MILRRAIAALGLALGLARLPAKETNAWPIWVGEKPPDGAPASWTALGPLIFDEPTPAGGRVAGFRPFYVHWTAPSGETKESTVLYPLFYYRTYGDTFSWSVFKLINRVGSRSGAAPSPEDQSHGLDIWPFYFSRETGDPATSYHAVLPIAGTVYDRLGYDRLSWVLFPLYAQIDRSGATTSYAPFPFIRWTTGAAEGFAIWPLFGHERRPGRYDRNFALWPFYWNNVVEPVPGAPPGTGPTRQKGILPFYIGEFSPGNRNESWLLFFGRTDLTTPHPYHETRYFWPFIVRGRGEDRTVDRWGPFYTHSVVHGFDKTWYLWPLVRRTEETYGDILDERTQFLFFLAWREVQRSVSRPGAPPASKSYLWPLVSTWDNGAGRRQTQLFSPLEGVFADNPRVRQTWSPLFAIWRHDQTAPGVERTSLFWKAVTWSRDAPRGRSEFHFGPIFSVIDDPSGRRWRLFSLEFPSGRAKVGRLASLP